MSEILVITGALLAVTGFASIEYYRQLRRAQREYEKARGAVEDVVLSFNRQLNREEERVDSIAYKVDSVASRLEKSMESTQGIGKKFQDLDVKISSLGEKEQALQNLDEVDKRLRDVATSQDTLSSRISHIEEQMSQLTAVPEIGFEPVIPIKREKALAPLTDTELSVLEMLAAEGSKTAPEIKERIKLTREHTARLMKKLYEGGYLERNTGKIPFKYSVKKEMEHLLKKKEGEAQTA